MLTRFVLLVVLLSVYQRCLAAEPVKADSANLSAEALVLEQQRQSLLHLTRVVTDKKDRDVIATAIRADFGQRSELSPNFGTLLERLVAQRFAADFLSHR